MKSYEEALHAVQSGILMEMKLDKEKYGNEFEERAAAGAKSNRTGINSAMVTQAAIVRVLFDKGIITEDEFFAALQTAANEEVSRIEEALSERIGKKVLLF